MPEFVCQDCEYVARDKWSLERHLARKYPCNIICIGSKEKDENGNVIKVIKQNAVTDEDKKPKQEFAIQEYTMKVDVENIDEGSEKNTKKRNKLVKK